MNAPPFFFLAIPTYNRSSLLKRAIESIFTQNYMHWKIYICDDGSTDSTQLLIGDYIHDERVVNIQLNKNSGVNKARNAILKKIEESDHEGFIVFLDDDDYFVEGALKVLSEAVVSHPSEKWILSKCINSKGEVLTKLKEKGQLSFIFDYMYRKNISGDTCHCMHTSLVRGHRFTEKFKNAEEWYFFANVSKDGYLFAIDTVSLVKDYQQEGLSYTGYNTERKSDVFKLKIATLKGVVTDKQLASQQFSLARELIKSGKCDEAECILREIPLVKKFTLRFFRYQLRALLRK